ncbi:MAG: MBL fold metallo-hydrolase, partial [Gemmatimonadales bacterium]
VPYRIGDVEVLPVRLDHGVMDVMGFRFGPIAYLTDVKSVPQAALEFLIGIEVLVVNALFEHRHPTHLSIPEAIELARVVGAKSTYLTHLTHSYAHADLSAKLPEGVEPAYDGLCVEL